MSTKKDRQSVKQKLENALAISRATSKRRLELLKNVTYQADEDCPISFRTRHMNDAIHDAYKEIEQSLKRRKQHE